MWQPFSCSVVQLCCSAVWVVGNVCSVPGCEDRLRSDGVRGWCSRGDGQKVRGWCVLVIFFWKVSTILPRCHDQVLPNRQCSSSSCGNVALFNEENVNGGLCACYSSLCLCKTSCIRRRGRHAMKYTPLHIRRPVKHHPHASQSNIRSTTGKTPAVNCKRGRTTRKFECGRASIQRR